MRGAGRNAEVAKLPPQAQALVDGMQLTDDGNRK
jgi:hypothetical protein